MTGKPAKEFGASVKGEKGAILRSRVVAALRSQIESGVFAPGDRLPSLTALCLQFEVSNITARSALRELVASGHAESRPRSGYFVLHTRPSEQELSSKNVIAVVVPSGDHQYEGGIVRGVTEECRKLGYRVIIANSNDDLEQEAIQLRELSRQVSGLIVLPAFDSANNAVYEDMLKRKVPLVFVDRRVSSLGLPVPLAATDNETGGYLATRHLLEIGRRRVYILSSRPVTSTEERLQGYLRAFREAGLEASPVQKPHVAFHNAAMGYTLTRALLETELARRPFEPFGIFASTEMLALTCYTALKEAGLRIPEDVAVVGFDDLSAILFDPPLTAVRQEPYEMGAAAARMLLQAVAGDGLHQFEVRLEPRLIVRNSTDAGSSFSLVHHLMNETDSSAPFSLPSIGQTEEYA